MNLDVVDAREFVDFLRTIENNVEGGDWTGG
jgi:hypothetical protein